MGPDTFAPVMISKKCNFNPRVPCGARLFSVTTIPSREKFQSTGPVWNPTGKCQSRPLGDIISIHGSRVEPDLTDGAKKVWETIISIHGSRVEPDKEIATNDKRRSISIHGSRVEPDSTANSLRNNFTIFQSTGPVWNPTKSR